MKRILIFSLAYVPYIGGGELAIKHVADRLDPNEYSFDMITLRFDRNLPKVERVGNVTVHRIGFTAHNAKVSDRSLPWQCRLAKLLFPFTAFLKAIFLYRQNKYDATWALMANQAGFAALFFKYAHPNTPYFLELQDGTPLSSMTARRRILYPLWWLYKEIYLKANVIKTISHFIEKITRETGYAGKVFVIPNGVDVAKFSAPIPEEKLTELKMLFNKRMGEVFVVTVSRLVLSRGVEDIIQALVYLPKHVKLLIAGNGEDREKLHHIAIGLKVDDRVIFAGHIDHSELHPNFKFSVKLV